MHGVPKSLTPTGSISEIFPYELDNTQNTIKYLALSLILNAAIKKSCFVARGQNS
jgi:hypothetical protein